MRRYSFGPMALILILVLGFLSSALAGELGQHPGYLSDTSDERYMVSREVVIVPLRPLDEESLRDKIFSEKITKEFQEKYKERFGQTEAEQVFNTPSQFFEAEIQPGVYQTADEAADEQKKFGNYMVKRTIEYHVDRWMKESPSARPVYELKERISNVNVEVSPGYKVRFRYSLSSNDLDVSVRNPHNIDNKVSLKMGSGFGPGSVDETLLLLGYPINKKLRVQGTYSVESEDYSLSGIRSLKKNWSTSLTGAETQTEGQKIIVGLNWHD